MRFAILILILISATASRDLRMVVSMFRHGYRAPMHFQDPVEQIDTINHKWTIPRQRLTDTGHRQHYLLGQEMRERYVKRENFLSEQFVASEFNIHTTQVIRTFESVNAHLAGMFPPGSHTPLTKDQADSAAPPLSFPGMEELKENLGLSPTQDNVGTFPAEVSFLKERHFNVQDECKGMDEVDYTDTEEFRELKQKVLSHLYDSFFEDTNIPDLSFFSDNENFRTFLDDLQMNLGEATEFTRKFKEHFVDSKVLEAYLSEFFENIWYASKNDYNGRIASSSILRHIISQFESRVRLDKEGAKYSSAAPKMVIYSGHDSNLVLLQIALRKAIDFKFATSFAASSLIFELIKEEEGYFVDFISNGASLSKLSLDEFVLRVKEQLIEDEEIASYCDFKQ